MTSKQRDQTRPEIISTCPVCSSELAVTRLHCGSCGTSIEGDFRVGRFGRLSREQMAVLESFLRSRGNLRDMERELGLSYPTVRSRVDAVVRVLGFGDAQAEGGAGGTKPIGDSTQGQEPVRPEDDAGDGVRAERRAILERLAKHEISATDAAEAIRALGRAGR